MPNNSPVALQLTLDDPELTSQELEQLTQNIQRGTSAIAYSVDRVAKVDSDTGEFILKGDEKQPGLLQMEVNLENLTKLFTWLHQRLVGKTTTAKINFGTGSRQVTFEFEGQSQKDLAATLDDVADFVERIQKIQRSS
ncbi:MAG: hypothetical protein AAGD25_17080 [Cyanobacteria bacterium P01_F01_bin.150]